MSTILLQNATLIHEGTCSKGHLLIRNDEIDSIFRQEETLPLADETLDCEGLLLLPGAIDDQVHFREPGLTHKGDLYTESRAAVAGGITSFMEMPNTQPQTITHELLEQKFELAAQKSAANYSFFMGATNDNFNELQKIDPKQVCGVKIFMGSSTGNMLVDSDTALSRIFADIPMLIAVHCEEESIVKRNLLYYQSVYESGIPIQCHPLIRSAEACYRSSARAIDLAHRYQTKLHLLHLSTAMELSLLEKGDTDKKKITGEACVHHLWFSDADYERLGNRIKWNPAIKTWADREALRTALNENQLDVVATDHAPHSLEEKNNPYSKAPSGGPLVQHALVAMLEMVRQGIFTYEKVVEKMCHQPAKLFQIDRRGFLRKGYKADLVLVNPNDAWTVAPENILYKCGWSPFEGTTFSHKIKYTFVNGKKIYENGILSPSAQGERLHFNR